jgi:hypothetical protein
MARFAAPQNEKPALPEQGGLMRGDFPLSSPAAR